MGLLLVTRRRVENSGHLGDLRRGEAAPLRVLANQILVFCQVDAEGLVRGGIGFQPLDARAALGEGPVGLLCRGAQGVYREGEELPEGFLTRRAAGNAIELLGIVAFRASPVWVLAALADASGMGRRLIPEIADALKAQGLLEPDAQFTTVDEMLDGLERTSSRMAATVNTPPLDVAGLRTELDAIRDEARPLRPSALPTPDAITDVWMRLNAVAARQNRSVFETSSMIAVSAATRTGQLMGAALLDHYIEKLLVTKPGE